MKEDNMEGAWSTCNRYYKSIQCLGGET